MVAPGWVRAWEAAERGIAPRAGLIAGQPCALWFLALWHLLMVWTWAWGGAGNEAGAGDEEAGGWRAASAAVRGAACGVGLVAQAVPGAEGDSGGMLKDKEDGFVSALDGTVGGGLGGEVQWFGGRGAESPRDCAGSWQQESPGTLLVSITSLQ